jgi:hypothetical protein
MVVTLLPILGLGLGIGTFYVLVYVINRRDFSDDATHREKRLHWRRKATRLVLFTLFMIYPGVSSYILNAFACRKVADTYYLLVDFNLICYDARWDGYAAWAGFCIALFPIGIPVAFFLLLLKNKAKLQTPEVGMSLGFLYQAYSLDVWYFELVAMGFKLFLTSMLLFFPAKAQMPLAMTACIIYLIIVLLKRPYAHAIVETTEIVSVSCLANIFFSGFVLFTLGHPGVGSLIDVLMSILMIAVTLVVIVLFGWQVYIFGKRDICTKRFTRKKLAGPMAGHGKSSSRSSLSPKGSDSVNKQSDKGQEGQ